MLDRKRMISALFIYLLFIPRTNGTIQNIIHKNDYKNINLYNTKYNKESIRESRFGELCTKDFKDIWLYGAQRVNDVFALLI